MEEGKKRVRDESESDQISPESKRFYAEQDQWVGSVRLGFDSVPGADFDLGSPERRQYGGDIFDLLDGPYTPAEPQSEIHGLDSFIKSFEEEILHPAPASEEMPQTVIDLTSADSQPELGYLLEASDDELGLPPSGSKSPVDLPPDASVLDSLAAFEDELPSYDSFELGIPGGTEEGEYGSNNGGAGEFVTVDGLFDYSDFSWRPESLPAL
ncbi:hypothetical protein DM860_010321 [Cuscuta australis]|uniref:Uncharacterized protein n=1 Tax=Cuscuta australis TaxID=267555 RepID=A0A328D6U9_9ASTE|nr:hypothetical protein DM860_010321 [Cuscuta australis]